MTPEFGPVPEPTEHLSGEEIMAQGLDVQFTFTHTNTQRLNRMLTTEYLTP